MGHAEQQDDQGKQPKKLVARHPDKLHRFGRAGWLNVYVPSAEILHDKGHSTGRDPARNLRAHHDSTYIYLTSRHIGWWRAPLRWTMRGALKVRARAAVRKSRRELARGGAR